jgi:hypothetical protein
MIDTYELFIPEANMLDVRQEMGDDLTIKGFAWTIRLEPTQEPTRYNLTVHHLGSHGPFEWMELTLRFFLIKLNDILKDQPINVARYI